MDNVMEHIFDPQPLLIECRRVLKTKGVLIILVPGAKGYTRDPDHKVFYNFQKMNSILSSNGLVPEVQHQLPLIGLSKYLSSFCFMVVSRSEQI